MKIRPSSFLFFLLSMLACYNIKGQTISKIKTDSSSHYYQILLKPQNSKDYNQAIKYYQLQYEKHIESKSILKAANDLEIIANGEYNIGDFNESEKVLIQALKLHQNSKSSISHDAQKRIYHLLGILYYSLKSYDKSLALYSRSLNAAKNNSDSISTFINVSNVLREKENFTKSIDTLKHALNLVEKSNNLYLKGYILDNLGYTEFLSKNDSSITHLEESLSLREKLKDTTGLYSSYRHLSLYYKQNSRFQKASLFAQKALNISKSIEDPSYELEALGLLASLDEDKNIKRFKYLNDSIETVNQNNQNNYAAMKYDVEKEQQQTQLAKLDSERQKRLKTIYLSSGIFAVFISITTMVFMSQRRKRKQLQTIQQTEAFISKKIHDGLANDTFQVLSELQNLEDIPEHILNKLDKMYLETRDISKSHSPLIEGANFQDQLISRLNSYKSKDLNVITRNLDNINWSTYNKIKKNTIYMVLGELMTNNKKHSHANLALISFDQNRKKLKITYKDNGSGEEIKKGNGIQNMESRIHALNGTIIFDPELGKGLTVQIQV